MVAPVVAAVDSVEVVAEPVEVAVDSVVVVAEPGYKINPQIKFSGQSKKKRGQKTAFHPKVC